MAEPNGVPRRGIEEIARFTFDDIQFTLCVSIRGRLEIEAVDASNVWSASFSNAEALSLTAGSLSADGVFAFLRNAFTNSASRKLNIVKGSSELDPITLVLTGQGILKSGGYSFRLPRGRRASLTVPANWKDSLRTGARSKNNPVIRYYEQIRSSKSRSDLFGPSDSPSPTSSSQNLQSKRNPAVSQVVVPDEEAMAAYRDSLTDGKPNRNEQGRPAATSTSNPNLKLQLPPPPGSSEQLAAAAAASNRNSSPQKRPSTVEGSSGSTQPFAPGTGEPLTPGRARAMSAARTKVEGLSHFRAASFSSASAADSEPSASVRHLLVDFRLIPAFPPGPDVEFVATLCGRELRDPLTEPFYFAVSGDGKPLHGGKSARTVFRELPTQLADLFLLVRVFRRAPIGTVDTKNNPRRPMAFAILELGAVSALNRIGQDAVETLTLLGVAEETQFWHAHNSSSVKPAELKQLVYLKPIGVTLTSLPAADKSPDASLPAQKAAELLSETSPTFPLQPVTDSSVPPQPILRYDLYVTLLEGNFALKKPRAIEVTARLSSEKNQTPILFVRGAGAASTATAEDSVTFFTVAQQNQPRWDETVIIRLPQEILRVGNDRTLSMTLTAHTVGKKKRKEICKGQVVLVEPAGPIANGSHTVQLSASGIVSSLVGSERSTIKLRTVFVRSSGAPATQFTKLTGWKSMRLDDLMEIIQSIPQTVADLPYSLLADTLAALVGVLDNHSHEFVSNAVISALCIIVGTFTDEKQPKQAREALDYYIDCLCNGMKHPERLYGAMAKFIEKPKERRSNQILSALKSLTYICRICALSAFAQPDGSPPPGPALFKSPSYIFNLDLLLRRLIDIITARDAELYSAQIAALRGIPMLLDHVAQIVKARDAASLISMLITEINSETTALVQEKVKLIDYFARSGSPVLEDPQLRAILWPIFIRETTRHIRAADPTLPRGARSIEEEACRLSVVALHQLIDFAQTKACPDDDRPADIADLALFDLLLTVAAPAVGSVLPKVQAPAEPSDNSILRYDMAMAFLAALYVIPGEETHRILSSESPLVRNSIISCVVEGLADLLSSPTAAAFPPDWDDMIQFQYKATETILAIVATYVSAQVLPSLQQLAEEAAKVPPLPAPAIGAFGAIRTLALRPLAIPSAPQKLAEETLHVVKSLLQLMSNFVMSPQLCPDSGLTVSEGMLALGDELRDSIAYSIPAIWANLGPAQLEMLESMMRPVVLFSLAKYKSQKKTARMVLSGAAEQCAGRFGDTSRVRSLFYETICRCFGDMLRSLDGTKDSVTKWALEFVTAFSLLHPEDPVALKNLEVIQSHVVSVISMLYDIEMTPPELDIDERILRVAGLIELLTFIGERRGLSFQLSSLASLHLQCGTTVEGGYVLAALAETLPWSTEPVEYLLPHELVDSSISLTRLTHTARKVRVITEAMELLAMGAQWEEALSVSMPLATFFDAHFRHTDYLGVAKKQAMYVEAMTDPQRVWPSYWYIKFSGPAFPDFTQASAFVIANYALESQSDMMKRLQIAYPSFPINYGIGTSDNLDISRIDVCEVSPVSADAIHEAEVLSSQTGLYTGADASVSQHRMRRRARHWRCTIREGESEVDYEFETLLSFPALIPRLPIIAMRKLDQRPISGATPPPVASSVPQSFSAGHIRRPSAQSPANLPSGPTVVEPSAPNAPTSSLIPSLTPKERPPSRAGSANRGAFQLSLPASQLLQQQINAAQTQATPSTVSGVLSPRSQPPSANSRPSSPPPAQPTSPALPRSGSGGSVSSQPALKIPARAPSTAPKLSPRPSTSGK